MARLPMDEDTGTAKYYTLAPLGVVLLLGAALLLPRLGEPKLIHSDEGHYVGAALEALAHAEWVVPLRGGSYAWDYGKPPLAHDLMAASVSLFGLSKASLRLPTTLGALLALCLVFLIGERLQKNAGLVAALLLASAPLWAHVSRRIWSDHLLAAFDAAAILLYAAGREKRRWPLMATAILCLAASLMTKQLAGGFAVAALVLAELSRGLGQWRRLVLLATLPVAPLVVWFLVLYGRVGDEAFTLISFHLGGRVQGLEGLAIGPGIFMHGFANILGWGLVFTGIVGVGWLIYRRQRETTPRFLLDAMVIYLGLALLAFGVIVRSSRAWYTYPAAYFCAIAAGVLLVDLLAKARKETQAWPLVVMGLSAFSALQIHDHGGDSTLPLALGLFAAGALFALERWASTSPWRPRLWRHLPAFGLGLVVAVGLYASVQKNLRVNSDF